METYNPDTFFIMFTCSGCGAGYSVSRKNYYQLETNCPFCDCNKQTIGATIVTDEGRANIEKYLGFKEVGFDGIFQ